MLPLTGIEKVSQLIAVQKLTSILFSVWLFHENLICCYIFPDQSFLQEMTDVSMGKR